MAGDFYRIFKKFKKTFTAKKIDFSEGINLLGINLLELIAIGEQNLYFTSSKWFRCPEAAWVVLGSLLSRPS